MPHLTFLSDDSEDKNSLWLQFVSQNVIEIMKASLPYGSKSEKAPIAISIAASLAYYHCNCICK
jgi:hypothetical protein